MLGFYSYFAESQVRAEERAQREHDRITNSWQILGNTNIPTRGRIQALQYLADKNQALDFVNVEASLQDKYNSGRDVSDDYATSSHINELDLYTARHRSFHKNLDKDQSHHLSMKSANFSKTRLGKSNLSELNLINSRFIRAHLEDVVAKNSNFGYTIWRNGEVVHSVFTNSSFQKVDISEAFFQHIDFRHSYWDDPSLSKTWFDGCDFTNATFKDLDFTADTEVPDMGWSNISGASITLKNFDNSYTIAGQREIVRSNQERLSKFLSKSWAWSDNPPLLPKNVKLKTLCNPVWRTDYYNKKDGHSGTIPKECKPRDIGSGLELKND